MPDFRVRLDNGPLLGDGAMGTELLGRGASLKRPLAVLNIERPEWVAAVHRAYVEAGSDLIITNTFSANAGFLAEANLGHQVQALNRAGVEIARDAAGPGVLVLGGLGPSGAEFPPTGEDPAGVRDLFCEQVDALAAAGVDALILETFFDLRETLLALDAARGSGLPVIASMTFAVRPDGVFTFMDDAAADCARALTERGADVIGANCTVSVDGMEAVALALGGATRLPLMLQPNAGQPEIVDGCARYHETPAHFAAGCKKLADDGARILGGCCGTTPAFIRALRGVC